MSSLVRRHGPAVALCLSGVAILLLGTAGSVAYAALAADEPVPAPAAPAERTSTGGLELRAAIDLDAGGLPDVGPVGITLAPPQADALPLPGASVDRGVDVAGADVGLDTELDLAAGSHRVRPAAPGASVADAAVAVARTPGVAPVAAAAAAFTLAGLVAWSWTSLKACATRLAILPAVALYARISRAEVFENAVRERIFAAIRQNPGLSASDLARLADVSWGTTMYHLDVLEQTQMVTSLRKGRYRRYFENGAALGQSKDAVATLRNPVTAMVVDALRARPGVTQKDLACALAMTPQALHWHLARLVQTGLVRKEREGRVVRHYCAA